MGTSKMIDRLENLWEKDPYKKVERGLRYFYKGLDEEEKKETAKELEELSKNIPSKEIPDYDPTKRAFDFISKGKRYYIWAGTTIAGLAGMFASAFTVNSDLFIPSFISSYLTTMGSLPGWLAGLGRGKNFDSYKAEELMDLPGSEFEELRNEYSF